MVKQQINTNLLGAFIYDTEEGVSLESKILLDNIEVTIDFDIFEAITSPKDYESIQRLTDQIPVLYKKAKAHLLQQAVEGNTTIDFYFEFHINELTEDVLAEFEVESIENITNENLIQGLKLSQVWFAQNENNELDLTFDFRLIPEYSDELLVIRFDETGEIAFISHES